MDMPMGSTTANAASATATASMGDGMDMGGGCKISMLWNWYTVDSCFISSTWHITSSGMFAGSCIGVILLVIILEFLRRAGKEYDRHLVRQAQAVLSSSPAAALGRDDGTKLAGQPGRGAASFRPNILQQAIRALLHMLQFAVAYFIMLLAMYYNGYYIICIFIGAYIGSFIFSWETIALEQPQEEVTVCCG